jgi:hypothetical protein
MVIPPCKTNERHKKLTDVLFLHIIVDQGDHFQQNSRQDTQVALKKGREAVMNANPILQFRPGILRRACTTPLHVVFAHLCLASCLLAQEKPGGESDRLIMKYLAALSDDQLGKKLEGVRLQNGSFALAGHTLLHRITLPAKQAHVYVLRKGSLAMGMPVGHAWVEAKGKPIPLPEDPAGEPREAAYNAGEVYTFAEINPGDGLVELSYPTEEWIKSLQSSAEAAKWGMESMATVEDPDGFSNVRNEDGKVIATVKNGERFLAIKPFAKSAQWEAWLANGIVGLVHSSRVRVLSEEPLMKLNFEPCKAAWKQAAAQHEAKGLTAKEKPHPDNYYPTLLRASEGDLTALSRFFARNFEDAPADGYVRDAWRLLHLVGDSRFAEMLKRQPPEPNYAPTMLVQKWTTAPISDGKKYLERHFPQTSAALFSK